MRWGYEYRADIGSGCADFDDDRAYRRRENGQKARGNAIQLVATLTALCQGRLDEPQEDFALCQACYDVARTKKAGRGVLGLKSQGPTMAHQCRNLGHVANGLPGIMYWYSATTKGLNLRAQGHVVTAQLTFGTDGNVIERVTTLTALCETNLAAQCGEHKLVVKTDTSFVEQSLDRFLFEVSAGALVGVPLCEVCTRRREQILRGSEFAKTLALC